ncbi:LuxR C-terminal-related transcriptional regulator [Glutamicibacter sp. NPDC087344]|uniref:helix-turn-helix transcriptional regulator n=1 Tax=Glutamicibacter sp. NPDC087344 TaxID=3363994 RepID=UPI00382D7D26
MVSGPSGSGRRASAEAAHSQLNDAPRLIRLNGSSFGQNMPLGVLAFLLAQIETAQQPTHHELVHGLARLLCPEGKPSVVLLGKPDLIDEESGSLLAQLAAMRKIKLVVVCDEIQDLPQDILALFRSGQLEHVSICRMNTLETRAFLESELQGPISAFAASTLQYLADSNRGVILKLARIWIANGQLSQESDTWVLRDLELGNGPAVQTLFNSMASGLDDGERVLLYALALGGPVSREMVHRAAQTKAMDQLIAKGQVKVVPQAEHRLMIAVPLLRLMLRQSIDPEMERSGRDLVAQLHQNAETALTLSTISVLSDLGQNTELLDIAEDYSAHGYAKAQWVVGPFARVRILKLHIRALLRQGEIAAATVIVRKASENLHAAIEDSWSQDRLLRAQQELELLTHLVDAARAEEETNFEANALEASALPQQAWMTRGLNLRAMALQSGNYAARARQSDAQAITSFVSNELRVRRLGTAAYGNVCFDDLGEVEEQLLLTEMLCGMYSEALVRATELAAGKFSNPQLIARAESLRGILFALQSDYERALKILEPSLAQLQKQGSCVELSAVEAVVAHSMIMAGRRSDAAEIVGREYDGENNTVPVNFYTWVTQLFSSMSLAVIGMPEVAIERMTSFAVKAHAAGYLMLELGSMAYVLRLGGDDPQHRLGEVSALCQGPLAEMYSELSTKCHDGSADLFTVLRNLVVAGHLLMATVPGNTLVASLTLKDQRKLAKLVSTVKRPAYIADSTWSESPEQTKPDAPNWAGELTKRESQIALLAISGKTNLEIARFNGVSIRTVEGHLYQVYSKLQVRNRQELTALDRTSRRAAGQL